VSTARVLLVATATLLIIPPVVFAAVALHSGMSIGDALAALTEQYQASRLNLLVTSLVGLFPMLLLLVFLGVRRLLKKPPQANVMYAIAGVLPPVLVTVFIHFEFWPTFLPGRTYPGFPHGLEFIIGPAVFAPVGMLIALVFAWLFVRRESA